MGPDSQKGIVGAINGLTDAIGALVTELRMQRVTIAKLAAQRVIDKEDTAEELSTLGALVVEQERKVNQLHLVRPAATHAAGQGTLDALKTPRVASPPPMPARRPPR